MHFLTRYCKRCYGQSSHHINSYHLCMCTMLHYICVLICWMICSLLRHFDGDKSLLSTLAAVLYNCTAAVAAAVAVAATSVNFSSTYLSEIIFTVECVVEIMCTV